ncbi:MAG: hypothetical protein ACM4D3_24570 [Candidatus Sericytochromatia bacterium]
MRALVGRGWRPRDCSTIDDYCGQLERWVFTAADLLDRRVVACAVSTVRREFAYRDSAGEQVRVRALRVSENGCWCQACQAFWEPTEFHWLARLPGCEPLPA